MKLKTLVCLSLITLVATLATAQRNSLLPGPVMGGDGLVDWAQFNFDAAQDGYNPYETILSPTTVGNVTLKWSYTPSEGPVEASPVVANSAIYFVAEYNNYPPKVAVYALDANTGDFIWKYVPAAPAYGSPAVANGLVYVVAGHVYALDASTGAVIWQSQDSSCDFSPTFANGKVFVVCDLNLVYALDAQTARPIWQYSTKGKILSSPAVTNGMLYVNSGYRNVYALNVETGAVKWEKQLGPILSPLTFANQSGSGQTVANGVLYVGITTLGDHLYALDVSTGALIWKVDGIALNFNCTPAVANGVLYVPYGAFVYALNASTGATIWKYQVYAGTTSAASPVVANGVVYVPSAWCCAFGLGRVVTAAVDASTGMWLWDDTQNSYEYGAYLPTPAVVNGTIYTTIDARFGAFGLPNM